MKDKWIFKKTTVTGLVCLFCWIVIASLFLTFPTSLAAGELNVALFQWVPRLEQFKSVIDEAWSRTHPDVTLNFVDWDCYDSDPTKDLDVFVFDGIFLSYFQSRGFLEQISPDQVTDFDDILEFVRNGTQVGGNYYGIPQLACTGFFFCQGKSDGCGDCIGSPDTLSNIYSYVGENSAPDCVVPGPGSGMLMDLAGGTTCALLYLDAVQDLTGTYTPNPTLPAPGPGTLNPGAVTNLQLLVRMTGASQAQFSTSQAYQRAGWYSSGSGKALVHYSESTWRMWYQFRDTVLLKVMPLGPKPVNLLYVDIAGIKPGLEDPKKALALELANLITGTETMVKCLKPRGDGPDQGFQYLLPVRTSVFNIVTVIDNCGLYAKFYKVLRACNPRVFRVGTGIKDWLNSGIKDVIKAAVFALPGKKLKKEKKRH